MYVFPSQAGSPAFPGQDPSMPQKVPTDLPLMPRSIRDPTSAIGPKREHAPRSDRFFAFCPLCCTYTQILLLTWWPQPVFQAQRWLTNTTPHLGPGCVELKGEAVPARYPQPGRALAPRRTAICQLGVILAQAINTPSY